MGIGDSRNVGIVLPSQISLSEATLRFDRSRLVNRNFTSNTGRQVLNEKYCLVPAKIAGLNLNTAYLA